jgi:type I restriction enzyme M protein
VMIDIRGNFFYTRTVPCQLWFFDRAKEKDEARRDHVLMLDARNIFRKVSRSVCDFSPEQQRNIAAIVWLYRAQSERFLKLVESYLAEAIADAEAASAPLVAFEDALGKLLALIEPFAKLKRENDPLAEPWAELIGARVTLAADIEAFGRDATARAAAWKLAGRDNAGLNAARVLRGNGSSLAYCRSRSRGRGRRDTKPGCRCGSGDRSPGCAARAEAHRTPHAEL